MSDWIEERINERQARQARQAAMALGIEPLWENLCTAIGSTIEKYSKRVPRDMLNWSGLLPASIWVTIGKGAIPHPSELKIDKLVVELDRESNVVKFTYEEAVPGRTNGVFGITLNGSDEATFVDNGTPVRVEEAVRLILDPLLFGDLLQPTQR